MSLLFPIDKSFYKSDNLFKHDFLLRKSFDAIDLLWYRTHESVDQPDQPSNGLDEKELWRIERIVENCPDNELESTRLQSLADLLELQKETELFDFYFEHFFHKTMEVIKEDAMVQKCNQVISDLKVIESEELTIDYEGYWDYVYEKACLKTMISPQVLDKNFKSVSRSRRLDTSKGKVNSDSTDLTAREAETVQNLKGDEVSLMNARILMQQLKEKRLEDDRLTYINVFADEDDGGYVDKEVSSSGTLSEIVDDLTEDVSRMTEVSYEKMNSLQGDDEKNNDPFKDTSFDSLYYAARQVFDRLKHYSNQYFTEAPVVLLENDLVLEMKDREFKYMTFYNKTVDKYVVKITDKDGNEGYNSRQFRQAVLRTTDLVLSQMERTKQEAVATVKAAEGYDLVTFAILRSPKVVQSDYRKLLEFDMKDEETKRIGQKRKLKNYKTMVCLAGRTKLRRYDHCEEITISYNKMREPMLKIAQSTAIAQEHANIGINSYLDTLLSSLKKRMIFEHFPVDLHTNLYDAIYKTKQVLEDLEKLKVVHKETREIISRNLYKPHGEIKKYSNYTIKLKQPNKDLAAQELENMRRVIRISHPSSVQRSNANIVLKSKGKEIKEKRPLKADINVVASSNKEPVQHDYFIPIRKLSSTKRQTNILRNLSFHQ